MKKQLILTVFALLLSVGCIGQKSIYDFTVMDINGEEMSLDKYKGSVLLIVNVASKCGLTPQYKGLEELYREFKEQGLEILAFPCNQFLEQEPGSNDEILEFCTVNYDITFPLFGKIDVNGSEESPLYTFLKKQAPFNGYPEGSEEFADQLTMIHQKTGTGFEKGDAIKWNFCKFLVSRDGTKIIRFEPMVSPEDMKDDILRMLEQ